MTNTVGSYAVESYLKYSTLSQSIRSGESARRSLVPAVAKVLIEHRLLLKKCISRNHTIETYLKDL